MIATAARVFQVYGTPKEESSKAVIFYFFLIRHRLARHNSEPKDSINETTRTYKVAFNLKGFWVNGSILNMHSGMREQL